MILCLDIETATRPSVLSRMAFAEGASGLAWIAEHAGDRALDPLGGQVICWATCADPSGEVRSDITDEEGGEVAILRALEAHLLDCDPEQIVAHGGHSFDFPFLRSRSLALGLERLPRLLWQPKPWDTRLVDTSDPSWCPRPARPTRGWGYSLDALSELMGIERPPTLPGAEVPSAWYAGRADEVRAHCVDDVRTLRRVWARLAAARGA